MPKVSVLVPAYNVEPYVCQCIDSVLNQTFQDFEIICVDDASTDKTLSILREYETKDARIHVFCNEKNMGQSVGRNRALTHALGKYVYMLDADDMILPNTLEELVLVCEADYLDVAGFETRQFADEDTFKIQAENKTIEYSDTSVLNGKEALMYCMDKEAFSLSVPTFIMKKTFLEDIELRFTEGILHEDVGYIFELITRAGRIRFLHKTYFLRRIRGNSTMTKGFTSKNIEGYIKSFLRSFELEPVLYDLYGNDDLLREAVDKWKRDIFGRITQLYLSSENVIYYENGGSVDEEVNRIFEILKLTNYGAAKTENIIGRDKVLELREKSKNKNGIYICGTGQYAIRAIDMAASIGLIIKGIIVEKKEADAFRGFLVYDIADFAYSDALAVMGVSHYNCDKYEDALKARGCEIVHIDF